MPSAFKKKPKLVRFVYDDLPLNQRDLEDLLLIVRMLAVDRERILQIDLSGCDDPEEIRIASLENGYYLGLSFPMEDFGWTHPLLLAAEDLSVEDVLDVVSKVCGEEMSTGDIPAVTEKLKDVTANVFGKD